MATRRKIVNWLQIHLLHMPQIHISDAVSAIEYNRKFEAAVMNTQAEDTVLSLPLALPTAQCLLISSRLMQKELMLRVAQADDALANLRRHLRVGAKVFNDQTSQTSGTGMRRNTRMLNLRRRYDTKVALDAEQYHAARAALSVLDPDGSWQNRFLPLEKKDVHPPGPS
jgi:hypothetical protein